ncbi:MAG TPA: cation diffusion facilitator family transporter [Nitrososphaeraceae archaeon]|nr:cation diffusion facilitator family transporter [Nitrososphaeraceae archaeon]
MSAASKLSTGYPAETRTGRIKVVFILLILYLVSTIVAGLLTESLVPISNAGDLLTDIGALSLILFAIYFLRKPPSPKGTYGFYRIGVLTSLAISAVVIIFALFILYEAILRIFIESTSEDFSGMPLVIVAAVGIVVNIIGMLLLRKPTASKKDRSLSIESASLIILNDIFAAIAVIATGTIIIFTNYYPADSIISIGLAIFIIVRTWSLLKKSIDILMESVPNEISYENVRNAILEVQREEILEVRDLHIWSITSGTVSLSTHVTIRDITKAQEIKDTIKSVLKRDFNITHTTIEVDKSHESFADI